MLKGAGPYHVNCAPCHGSPLLRHPVVPMQMTPHPPYLPSDVPQWDPEELFYIVKHGIKFTGMPAWPARKRDDEVWAVVAFLLRLPTMDQGQYRSLVFGPATGEVSLAATAGVNEQGDISQALVQACAACHGREGRGRGADPIPLLAGQRPSYLAAALQAFASGHRHSGIMQPVAQGLSPRQIRQLALYYGEFDLLSANPVAPSAGQAAVPLVAGDAEAISEDAASLDRGAVIAWQGVPGDRVPSCVDCHGPVPTQDKTDRNPHYPSLAGQNAEYLVLQLQLFQQRARGGSGYAHLMHPVADALSAQQMRDVARYFASLTAEP